MLEKVREEIIKFNQDRDWDQFHSPENLAKSIAIESGELLECFQWDNSFNKQDVCEWIDCSDLSGVNGFCDEASMEEIEARISGLSGWIHFIEDRKSVV